MNSFYRPSNKEVETAPRFSFSNRKLARLDVVIANSPRPRRALIYPTPPEECRAVRDGLAAEGLVLGKEVEVALRGLERFAIPVSARPISHDARNDSKGAYDYGDTELFADIGHLLGRLASSNPKSPLVLDEEIGNNVAMVEFTKPGQAKALLVPGFELSTKALETEDEALTTYGKHLYEEFGRQFDRHADDFLGGFRSALR